MPTPHLQAQAGDYAETILMPGDPLRAQMIAQRFLSEVRQVNSIRNMWGYTGYYRGQRISVQAHGMGIPSISIYAHELINHYGAKKLIRLGSCGAIQAHLQLRDVVVAMGASTDSKVNRSRFLDHDFAALADFNLLTQALSSAADLNLPLHVGNVFSTDLFYSSQTDLLARLQQMQILAVEMEAAGLYGLAAQHQVAALTLLTVSDHLTTGASLSATERQDSFIEMCQLALSMCTD